MSDDQRDLIEQDLTNFIKICTDRIKDLEESIGKQKFGVPLTPAIIERRLSELFAHQTAIVSDLYEQLRDFSRRFNEARNLRHQHAAEQVAAFSLYVAPPVAPAERVVLPHSAALTTSDAPLRPETTSTSESVMGRTSRPPEDSLGELEQENIDLNRELTDVFFRAKQVEGTALEIARLDESLQQHMEHQDVQIQSIIQNLVAVNQNVESATTNISKKNDKNIAFDTKGIRFSMKHNRADEKAPLQDLWADESGNQKLKKKRAHSPTPIFCPADRTPMPLSYQPAEEEHQAALAKAIALEEKRLKAEKRMAERCPVIRPMTVVDYQLSSLQHLLRGEPDSDEEEDSDAASGEEVSQPAARRKPPVRLTQAQRNRRLHQKQLEEEQKRAKEQKKLARAATQLGSILKLAAAREKELQARLARRKAHRATLPKRVGPIRIRPRVPVPLSDELPPDLRHAKAPSDLLKERMRERQEKGLVEARKRCRLHRKYPLKRKKVNPAEDFLQGRATTKLPQ